MKKDEQGTAILMEVAGKVEDALVRLHKLEQNAAQHKVWHIEAGSHRQREALRKQAEATPEQDKAFAEGVGAFAEGVKVGQQLRDVEDRLDDLEDFIDELERQAAQDPPTPDLCPKDWARCEHGATVAAARWCDKDGRLCPWAKKAQEEESNKWDQIRPIAIVRKLHGTFECTCGTILNAHGHSVPCPKCLRCYKAIPGYAVVRAD